MGIHETEEKKDRVITVVWEKRGEVEDPGGKSEVGGGIWAGDRELNG